MSHSEVASTPEAAEDQRLNAEDLGCVFDFTQRSACVVEQIIEHMEAERENDYGWLAQQVNTLRENAEGAWGHFVKIKAVNDSYEGARWARRQHNPAEDTCNLLNSMAGYWRDHVTREWQLSMGLTDPPPDTAMNPCAPRGPVRDEDRHQGLSDPMG